MRKPFNVMSASALAAIMGAAAVVPVQAAEAADSTAYSGLVFEIDGQQTVVSSAEYEDALTGDNEELAAALFNEDGSALSNPPSNIQVGENYYSIENYEDALASSESENQDLESVIQTLETNYEPIPEEDTSDFVNWGELSVNSVSADNNKEITINFNQNVEDVDGLEDAISIDGGEDNNDGSELKINDVSVEGETAVINLDTAADQQTEATISINDILEEDFETSVQFLDTTVPNAESATQAGPQTVQVEFSEPLDVDDVEDQNELQDAFSVESSDGSTLFVSNVNFDNNNRTAYVELSQKFGEGSYTITAGENNSLIDFAGYSVSSTSLNFETSVDEEAPTIVNAYSENQMEAVVEFDSDVSFTGTGDEETTDQEILDNIYHTNTSSIPEKLTIDGNQLHVKFAPENSLPNGNATLNIAGETLEDSWGNVLEEDVSTSFEVEADTTAPQIDSVAQVEDSQNEVEVTFNESISNAESSSYTVQNEEGESVGVTGISAGEDENKVTLTLNNEDVEAGAYTLTVEDVEDGVGNAIEEETTSFTIEDLTAPTTPDNLNVYEVNGETVVVVDFEEPMATSGEYAINDLSKYVIDGTSLSDLDSANISLGENNESVEISFDNEEAGFDDLDNSTLQGTRVSDDDGNLNAEAIWSSELNFVDDTFGLAVNDNDESLFTTIDENTVELQFDSNLNSFESDDFVFTAGENELEKASAAQTSENTVQFSFTDEFGTDNEINGETVEVSTADKNIGTNNSYGLEAEVEDVTLLDTLSPEIDTDNVTYHSDANVSEISLEFTEDVHTTANQITQNNFNVVDENGEDLELALEATTDISENQFSTALNESENTSATVSVYVYGSYADGDEMEISFTSDNYFQDDAGNSVQDFSVTADVYDEDAESNDN